MQFYLAVCVGVLAAEPFLPSSVAKCPSSASNKLLGALVKSGISPLSIPTFSATWSIRNNKLNYYTLAYINLVNCTGYRTRYSHSFLRTLQWQQARILRNLPSKTLQLYPYEWGTSCRDQERRGNSFCSCRSISPVDLLYRRCNTRIIWNVWPMQQLTKHSQDLI